MIRLYHGTSSNFLEQIRKTGLRGFEGRLTLSTSLEESKAYASWTARMNPGSSPVILEYEIPEHQVNEYLGPADTEQGVDSIYYPVKKPIPEEFLRQVLVPDNDWYGRYGQYRAAKSLRRPQVRVQRYRRER